MKKNNLPKTIFFILLSLDLIVVLLHLIIFKDGNQFFYMDAEQNLASYWSTTKYFIAALLIIAIIIKFKIQLYKKKKPFSQILKKTLLWLPAAFILIIFGYEESFTFYHNELPGEFFNLLPENFKVMLWWPILLSPLIIASVAYFIYLYKCEILPVLNKNSYPLIFVLIILSAIILEVAQMSFYERVPIIFEIMSTMEESMELFLQTSLIWVLFRFLLSVKKRN